MLGEICFPLFGDEATADALGFAGEITDAFGTLFEDITSGNPFQMIFGILSFIPNVISKINAFHDSKLNRTIEKISQKD